MTTDTVTVPIFEGFVEPQENWSKLPHQFIGALPHFGTKAEIVVVLYILRHTWGFHDNGKKITLDEFENGRWMKDKESGEYKRMDAGVGMSRPSIVKGLKEAAIHGFIEVTVDTSDKARVKKLYSLRGEGLKDFTPDVKKLNRESKETLHRSEKETIERNSEKETKDSAATSAAQDETPLNPIVIEQIGEAVAAADEKALASKAKPTTRKPAQAKKPVVKAPPNIDPEYRKQIQVTFNAFANQITGIGSQLLNIADKGVYADNAVVPPVELPELRKLHEWQRRVKGKQFMPKDAIKVQSLVYEWRNTKEYQQWLQKQEQPKPVPPADPTIEIDREPDFENPDIVQQIWNDALARGENPLLAAEAYIIKKQSANTNDLKEREEARRANTTKAETE